MSFPGFGDHTALSGAHYLNAPDQSRIRAFSLSIVTTLYLAAFLLFFGGWFDQSGDIQRPRAGAGQINSFLLASAPPIAALPASGGSGTAPASRGDTERAVKEQPQGAGPGKLAYGGDAALTEALAGALADDPLSGGGSPGYDAALRRHLARFAQPPRASAGRRRGIVVIRFRIDRDGRVVDARVLKSQGSPLDEAALATLWRAEPLPGVPAGLPTPLEVDVPIDFKASG